MNAKSTAEKKAATSAKATRNWQIAIRRKRRPPQLAKKRKLCVFLGKLECLVRLEFAIYPFRSIDFCVCAGRSMCSGLCYPHSTAPMVAMMFFLLVVRLCSLHLLHPLPVASCLCLAHTYAHTHTHTATQILAQSRILENYPHSHIRQPKCSTIRWKSA